MNGHGPPGTNGEDEAYPRSGLSATLRQNAIVESMAEGTGRLKHLILDANTREVTGLVVAFRGSEWLVPIHELASAKQDRIRLRRAWSDYLSSRSFDRRRFRSVQPAVARREGARSWTGVGTPLLDADNSSVRTEISIPEPQPSALKDGGVHHIPLFEERLKTAVQPEQAGVLRVSRRTIERKQTIEVTIVEEQVVFELNAGAAEGLVVYGGRELQPGETMEVTIATEEARVIKERIPLEEIAVRTETRERPESVQETLRRDKLTVVDPGRLSRHVRLPGTVAAATARDGGAPLARTPVLSKEERT